MWGVKRHDRANYLDFQPFKIDDRIAWLFEIEVLGNDAVFDGQYAFDQPGNSSAAFKVANVRFDRADVDGIIRIAPFTKTS
jgi:hypothetical protein